MTSIHTLFALLIIYQLKHLVADFLLQHNYMLRKILPGWDFVFPLALHCSVHGLLTLFICLYFRPEMWWLAFADFAIHFILDRFRSGPKYLGRYNDINTNIFWWILGFDQFLHHTTHIWMVWMILFG